MMKATSGEVKKSTINLLPNRLKIITGGKSLKCSVLGWNLNRG